MVFLIYLTQIKVKFLKIKNFDAAIWDTLLNNKCVWKTKDYVIKGQRHAQVGNIQSLHTLPSGKVIRFKILPPGGTS